MARFYFDVLQDGNLEVDHVGTECSSIDHARDEARRCALEMALDLRSSQLQLKIAVADHRYRQVLWLTITIQSGSMQSHVAHRPH